MTITNQQLQEAFLNPQMKYYFDKKLSPLPSAEVSIRVEETLKFLNMATYFHCNIPVSKEIDDVWHFWILETREYAQLCTKLQGRRFIHHSSNVYLNCCGQPNSKHENDLEEEAAMLGTYVLNYGPFEPDRIKYWVFAAHLVDACGWSVQQLNDWLLSAVVSPQLCDSRL